MNEKCDPTPSSRSLRRVTKTSYEVLIGPLKKQRTKALFIGPQTRPSTHVPFGDSLAY